MKRIFFFLLLCTLSVLTFAQNKVERAFASKVSQPLLQQTVHDLVQFAPRTGGTKRGDQSAAYVQQRFREAGLQSEIVEDPEHLVFTNERWTLQVEQPASLRGLIKNEWLAGYSPSVKTRKDRLAYANPEGGLEKGQFDSMVVLTERLVDQRLYDEIVKAGASCILSYGQASPTKFVNWAFITNLRQSNENPIPLFNISYRNGSRLKEEIEKGTQVILRFMARTTIAPGKPQTVVATLQGESDNYFIVCAHGDSDSGGPGADDNASGMAGVLEVARTLQSMINRNAITSPKYSIKFIVWGSEYYSTRHYVKREADSLGKILGVMNYDEIGSGATRNCLYFESNDVAHNDSLIRTLNAIGEEYVGKKGFWEEATTNSSQGGTDSYVFLPDYLQRLDVTAVEIPSVTVYTAAWDESARLRQTEGWASKAWKGHPDSVIVDFSRYYHSSLDIPSLTTDKEPFNMVWAVKAVGIALLRLAW